MERKRLTGDVSRHAWILVGLTAVLIAGAVYVGGTIRCGALGFPLDDGWIHQTYARNLAQAGQFAYVPGQASAGSTSPLWTLLLALGHVFRMPPILWSYILGAGFWFLTGWVAASLTERLFPEQRAVAPWVGLTCLLEWHMAWAAFSGMETTLFCFLSLLLIERYAARAHPFVLGLVGGLLFLTRPEGAVLVALLGLVILLDWPWASEPGDGVWGPKPLRVLADLTAGLAALVIPYVVFNMVVSGQLLPNTFYAKQAEYHALLTESLLARAWRVLRRPLIGAQALLVPGFVWQAVRSVLGLAPRRLGAKGEVSPFLRVLPVVWWAAYLTMYALRLPVDYQYGRYVMPTIPLLIIYGVTGTALWLRPRSPRVVVRLLSRAIPLAIGCLFAAFIIIGGQAYAADVCTINCEMVDVAVWLEAHTSPEALVAAHDIGAIGYHSGRSLLDLAGLVTPEVIPFIRDEDRLAQFIVDQGAGYLVTFPSWYPAITADDRFALLYETGCALTRERGGDNMAVYEVRR